MMKAAVIETGKKLGVQNIQAPSLPKDGAIIRVTGCGICGSDLDKLQHRTLAEGTVLGHEVVGVIETLSEGAKVHSPQYAEGQRVSVAHHIPCQQCYYCTHGSPSMCRAFKQSNITPGGFCEYIAISKEHLAHTVFPLPDDISDPVGSCIEPLSCCIRAVDRIPKEIGNVAFMIGLGFIGLLSSQYLKHQDYTVFGIDLKPDRVDLAQTHAMVTSGSTDQGQILDELFQKTEGRGADLVFLSIVNPATIALALKAVRDGGTLLLFTSYGKGEPLINQNELYFREINLITSYSPSLVHLQKAYDLIMHHHITVAPLISRIVSLNELNDAIQDYQHGEALKVFVSL